MQDQFMEKHQFPSPPKSPVEETQDTVAYLGVRLPKAQNRDSVFVPNPDSFKDFIHDEFALELQRDVAVAFATGDPIFIEGGTSIGKTRSVREICSRLGYEVHYANLNYGTDETKLMGKPMPNTKRGSDLDPEYYYWLGKVASGLVPEEGKIKVIILDEIGASMPGNLIVLHEILDSVRNGDPIDLSEWGNGIVHIEPDKIKIVALTNPPGKGYVGREAIDPALLRRFVYKKAPSELDQDTFLGRTKARFGLAPQTVEVSADKYLHSLDTALAPEQLTEIPGIEAILDKYGEFHDAAKKLVANRTIAADQPQKFTFDDNEEPRRVRDFILRFYNGDINDTFQAALCYYYSNKLETDVDKAKLNELIQHVEYIAPQNSSQRRGVDRSSTAVPERQKAVPEVAAQEQSAWLEVLGKNVEVPPIPAVITPEVKNSLEKLGFELRYIPKLDLDILDDLKRKGEEKFLDDLQSRYPNWRRYETLDDGQRKDPKVTRNLEEWFWGLAKEGWMEFPNLPGTWVAVETMKKPSYGESYDKTPVGKALGLDDRHNVSWNDANKAIQDHKRELLTQTGLPASTNVRMLEAIEWNLLANREGWGGADSFEWTNTETRDGGDSSRVVVGYSGGGGAAYAHRFNPEYSRAHLGFRLAVVLGS